jgi:DNA-binding MarR family transcriptional regulator
MVMAHKPLGPEDNAGFLLWRLTLEWRSRAGAALQPFGLTHTEYVLMALLRWQQSRDDTHPTQRTLADLGGLDPMLVSKTMRALADAGLVEPVADPSDARASRMALTNKGASQFHHAAAAIGEAHQEFLAPLGERRTAFLRDLRQLHAAMPARTRERHRKRSTK